MLAGRAGRQRYLRRPGGPTLVVILDEAAVWRRAVPQEVAHKQLRHLARVFKDGHLRDAALSPAASADFLLKAAGVVPG